MYRSFIHEDSKIRLSLSVAPGHRTVQEGLSMESQILYMYVCIHNRVILLYMAKCNVLSISLCE